MLQASHSCRGSRCARVLARVLVVGWLAAASASFSSGLDDHLIATTPVGAFSDPWRALHAHDSSLRGNGSASSGLGAMHRQLRVLPPPNAPCWNQTNGTQCDTCPSDTYKDVTGTCRECGQFVLSTSRVSGLLILVILALAASLSAGPSPSPDPYVANLAKILLHHMQALYLLFMIPHEWSDLLRLVAEVLFAASSFSLESVGLECLVGETLGTDPLPRSVIALASIVAFCVITVLVWSLEAVLSALGRCCCPRKPAHPRRDPALPHGQDVASSSFSSSFPSSSSSPPSSSSSSSLLATEMTNPLARVRGTTSRPSFVAAAPPPIDGTASDAGLPLPSAGTESDPATDPTPGASDVRVPVPVSWTEDTHSLEDWPVLQRWGARMASSLTVLVFLTHTNMTKVAFQLLTCTDVTVSASPTVTERRFSMDLDARCDAAAQPWSLGLAISVLFVFSVLLPALLFLAVLRRPHTRRLASTRRNFGFLFEGYRPGLEWWELVSVGRMFLLVEVVVMMGPLGSEAQTLSALSVIGAFELLALASRPRADASLTGFSALSALGLLSLLVPSLLPDPLSEDHLNLLILDVNGCVLAVGLVLLLGHLCGHRCGCRDNGNSPGPCNCLRPPSSTRVHHSTPDGSNLLHSLSPATTTVASASTPTSTSTSIPTLTLTAGTTRAILTSAPRYSVARPRAAAGVSLLHDPSPPEAAQRRQGYTPQRVDREMRGGTTKELP